MTDRRNEDPADRAVADAPMSDASTADEPGGHGSTPPHPSPAEGSELEGSPRPPRPSQAEGDREE